MKIHFHAKDSGVISAFLGRWTLENDFLPLLFTEECEPLYFDCDAAELSNCFMELEKKGFSQSVKEIFQGNHFYRSDTERCERCRRYRLELAYDKKQNLNSDLCDRCRGAI